MFVESQTLLFECCEHQVVSLAKIKPKGGGATPLPCLDTWGLEQQQPRAAQGCPEESWRFPGAAAAPGSWAEAGGEAWRGLWQRKGCRSCAERQESGMMCNTHYIEEKLKGLIDINYQVQFVAAQLTC